MKPSAYKTSPDQEAVYHRYAALALPRHTSYPAASYWQDEFPVGQYQKLLSETLTNNEISLYLHVPFCQSLCYYCACNKYILPKNEARSEEFGNQLMAVLLREIERTASGLPNGKKPIVRQLHFGGGTPTWLNTTQLEQLFKKLDRHFDFAPDGERAMELDPRVTSDEHLRVLRDFGFNRVSCGVQDFDAGVQEAVNRIQPFEDVSKFVDTCRGLGFDLINFDLIYGLPFQTEATMQATLEQVLKLEPTRIAFYRLAVIPEIFKWQRRFSQANMPESDLCLRLNLQAINKFIDSGYQFIGLDHFALPDDSLSKALGNETITRTFQGMTTGRGLPVIGIGPSSISQFPRAFAQSETDFFKWSRLTETSPDGFAVNRGIFLSDDDCVRRELLIDLYCYREIDKSRLQRRTGIVFDTYFADELERLLPLVKEGFVELTPAAIKLTRPLGELLIRVVAAVFDKYLPKDALVKGIAGKASRVG